MLEPTVLFHVGQSGLVMAPVQHVHRRPWLSFSTIHGIPCHPETGQVEDRQCSVQKVPGFASIRDWSRPAAMRGSTWPSNAQDSKQASC